MPRGILAGQLTLHVLGKRKRLSISTTITGGVVLIYPLGLFLPYLWEGLACNLNPRTCGGSMRLDTNVLPWVPQPKRGSPQPQLKGAHQSVGVLTPNLRGHADVWEPSLNSKGHNEVWESVSPTPWATWMCGNPHSNSKTPTPKATPNGGRP